MALTDRQKKGIGFLVGAGCFLAAGIVTLIGADTATLAVVFTIVASVGGILGLAITLPEL